MRVVFCRSSIHFLVADSLNLLPLARLETSLQVNAVLTLLSFLVPYPALLFSLHFYLSTRNLIAQEICYPWATADDSFREVKQWEGEKNLSFP